MIAFGCILLLLFLGAIYRSQLPFAGLLVQQLQTASFLGIIATGMMLVILLGHIDLSIPWTIGIGGMMATARPASSERRWAVCWPFRSASFCGVLVGLVNGLGVAYLRAPFDDLHARHERRGAGPDGLSHRWLLAAGPRPPMMRELAGEIHSGVPIRFSSGRWSVIVTVFMLTRTTLRPADLRDRQPRARRLSVGRRYAQAYSS